MYFFLRVVEQEVVMVVVVGRQEVYGSGEDVVVRMHLRVTRVEERICTIFRE